MNKNLTAIIRKQIEELTPNMTWSSDTLRMEFKTLEKYGVISNDELKILLFAVDGKMAPPAPEKNA